MNALLLIAGLGVVSLVAEFAGFRKWLTALVVIGFVAALAMITLDWGMSGSDDYYKGMMRFDELSLVFMILILSASLLWLLMFSGYYQHNTHQTDRTSLIIFVVAGGIIMTAFNNMAMLFLGIEILSLSLYTLAGSKKDSLASTEAAFKYFLMGSFATGFLLFGITLVYGATGSFQLDTISTYLYSHEGQLPVFFHLGVLLMLIGLAFKISAVPFHFWAPDVYEGSPLPVTAFMSTIVKVAAIAAFYRTISLSFAPVQSKWMLAVQVMMVLTLIVPNITAVFQSNVKRMLAYSSVGHVGFILLALVAGAEAPKFIIYYLAAYTISSLGAFFVVGLVEQRVGNTNLDSFKGLFKSSPLAATTLAIALMSLAGIPPLAGFFAKYMVFVLAISEGFLAFVMLAIAASLIGVYYYFRVIIAMFIGSEGTGVIQIPFGVKILLIVVILAIFGLGIFPGFFGL